MSKGVKVEKLKSFIDWDGSLHTIMNVSDYEELFCEIQEKGPDHHDIVTKMNRMSETEIDIFIVYELVRDENGKLVELWNDAYEERFGDGNYPGTDQDTPLDARQIYVFQQVDNCWHQRTGPNIDGLDGDSGEKLLEILNQTTDLQITAKLCLNRIKNTTDVVKANPNDLTQPEFVCKVVDQMINCAWGAQAEEILSYVGKYKCDTIISLHGKVLFPKVKNKY